jgi:hypothetical protein
VFESQAVRLSAAAELSACVSRRGTPRTCQNQVQASYGTGIGRGIFRIDA